MRYDYIKYHKTHRKNNFVIAKSNNINDAKAYVDSILKYEKKYEFYVRSKYEIDNSIIKEKYFLCAYGYSDNIVYRNINKLKVYQKKYPNAFYCVEKTEGGTSYLVFSEDKVYENSKLLSHNYEAIILIKPSWLKGQGIFPKWESDFKQKLRNNNVKTQIRTIKENFKDVKISRKANMYLKTNINISKYAKKSPDGAVIFVKSGKNAFWVKHPACLMTDKLVESAVKYFLEK